MMNNYGSFSSCGKKHFFIKIKKSGFQIFTFNFQLSIFHFPLSTFNFHLSTFIYIFRFADRKRLYLMRILAIGDVTGKGGVVYNFRTGICLESQKYPDSPNKPQWPSPVVRPGETYTSHCVFAFSTK